MPSDTPPPPPANGRDAFATTQTLANWLDLVRRVTLSLAVILGITVVVILVAREVFRQGIIIDPVIVQLPDVRSAPTPDLAAQQIARDIDLIQRAGVSEWRKLYVDQSSSPIDLQVPGAPLTLRTSIREVAAMFGVTRPTIRASVVIRRDPAGYLASVNLVGEGGARATCEAADTPNGVDEVLECVALSAIAFMDPKVAASYVFSAEQRACNSLDINQSLEASGVVREERRIKNRRDRCAFNRTRALIAKMLERGSADDLPWVSYVFGRIHLARAAALANIDRSQQLAELDQAIGRFADSLNRMPDSPTALAVLIDAYVRKGVSIHEATTSMAWSDEPTSPLQWQLYLAESTFSEAAQKLRSLPQRRSETLDALVRRLEGQLIYRLWMLQAHRRTHSGVVTVALGHPAELALLTDASGRYATAAKGPQSAELFIEWGNVLRALGEFDGAVEKYLRAADLSPGDSGPRLNIAIAYLDRVEFRPAEVTPLKVLIALGASSDYLAWSSEGGPYPGFTARIERVLALSGHAEDAELFKKCLAPTVASPGALQDAEIDRWKAAAALKVCIDQTVDRVNGRIVAAPRAPAAVPKVR
jgi:tetratricopeptide (TPR) repeat protein